MAHCRICKTKDVIRLSSLETIWCPQCRRYFDWKLKDGEQSVLIEGRIGDAGILEQKSVSDED